MDETYIWEEEDGETLVMAHEYEEGYMCYYFSREEALEMAKKIIVLLGDF